MKARHAVGIALGSLLLYAGGTILLIDRLSKAMRRHWL